MRSSLMRSVAIGLISSGIALSSAAADPVKVQYTPRYSTCICQFGYGGGSCVPALACSIEGGRCAQPCAAETK